MSRSEINGPVGFGADDLIINGWGRSRVHNDQWLNAIRAEYFRSYADKAFSHVARIAPHNHARGGWIFTRYILCYTSNGTANIRDSEFLGDNRAPAGGAKLN